MTEVSILVGVYNEQDYLRKSLESILNQIYSNLELIIVDDGSTDNSVDIIQEYDDDRITLIQNSENRGLTASLNHALSEATGKFVARQDADDISEPDRLERQVQFLEKHEDVAVVGTGAYLIDGEGQVIDRRIPKCDPKFDDFMEKGHLIHGSIMARRSILESVGGYNEFFRYGQDQELWLRLAQEYSIANIPAPLYRHRIHDEGVYFSRKDESALYERVAKDLTTGRIGSEKLDELEQDGVLGYYEELSPQRRAAFHRDLATRYLRYGHTQPAREECRKAFDHESLAITNILLAILAWGGTPLTRTVRWFMRRYLNTKMQLYNRLTCPYNFE